MSVKWLLGLRLRRDDREIVLDLKALAQSMATYCTFSCVAKRSAVLGGIASLSVHAKSKDRRSNSGDVFGKTYG